MGIFSKQKKNTPLATETKYAENIKFLKLDTVSDEQLLVIADQIKDNVPLVINFDLKDIDDINKSIAFLSGVCYALDGEVISMDEKILLFGLPIVFEDGSVHSFLKTYN